MFITAKSNIMATSLRRRIPVPFYGWSERQVTIAFDNSHRFPIIYCMLEVDCKCGKKFQVGDNKSGKLVQCPACSGFVRVMSEEQGYLTGDFQDLLSAHAFAGVDKWLYMFDSLDGISGSDYSFKQKKLALTSNSGKRLELNTYLLGTQKVNSQDIPIWRWSWADPDYKSDAELIAPALEMKKYGEAHGIKLLADPISIAAGRMAHSIVLVSTGILNATSWYDITTDDNMVYSLLIKDGSFARTVENPAKRICDVLHECLDNHPISNYKRGFEEYVKFYGGTVRAEGDVLVGSFASGNSVRARIDATGKLTELQIA